MAEVDDEAVAARLDVVAQPLGDPLRRPSIAWRPRSSSPVFGSSAKYVLIRSTVRPSNPRPSSRSSSTESATGCQTPVLAARRRVARETPATQISGPPHEPRREPAVEREVPALEAHAAGHLLERRRRQVEPFVEQLPALRERRAERVELALHPAGRDRGHDAPAGEEVQRRQLFQGDQRVASRDDQGRDAELQPLRSAGEEAERDERLGDRAVDRRVLVGNDQVVGHPAGVEARLFGRDRARRKPLRLEAFAVVREDQAEVERHCG